MGNHQVTTDSIATIAIRMADVLLLAFSCSAVRTCSGCCSRSISRPHSEFPWFFCLLIRAQSSDRIMLIHESFSSTGAGGSFLLRALGGLAAVVVARDHCLAPAFLVVALLQTELDGARGLLALRLANVRHLVIRDCQKSVYTSMILSHNRHAIWIGTLLQEETKRDKNGRRKSVCFKIKPCKKPPSAAQQSLMAPDLC